LVGREAPLGQLSRFIFGADIVFTWVASAIAASVVSFPLMVRAIIVAMQGVDTTLERSARSLGAGPLRTFLKITMPLCYNGLVAGILLGFVRAIGEFGATIVVAGNIPGRTQTIPLAIYSKVQLGKRFRSIKFNIYLHLNGDHDFDSSSLVDHQRIKKRDWVIYGAYRSKCHKKIW